MTTATASVILELRGVSVAYPGQPPIAADWSVAIGAGVSLLHGDTGTGKSTLLRVMAGEQNANAGHLTLAGTRLADDPGAYRQCLFFGDPATDAYEQISARACTAALSAGDANFDEPAWRELTEGFALAPHLDKPMYMLSTGSKRKVWLAAALASGRALTLLDEPAGALDAASIRCLLRALARLAGRSDRAIVVATADRLEAVALAATIELPLR